MEKLLIFIFLISFFNACLINEKSHKFFSEKEIKYLDSLNTVFLNLGMDKIEGDENDLLDKIYHSIEKELCVYQIFNPIKFENILNEIPESIIDKVFTICDYTPHNSKTTNNLCINTKGEYFSYLKETKRNNLPIQNYLNFHSDLGDSLNPLGFLDLLEHGDSIIQEYILLFEYLIWSSHYPCS